MLTSAIQRVLAGACCCGMLLGGGCGASRRAMPNVGTYTFLSGEFSGYLDAPLERVVPAAEEALRKAGLTPTARRGQNTAELRAKGADEREVCIRIKRDHEKTCLVCIVIGAVGDEDRSAALFQAIRAGL